MTTRYRSLSFVLKKENQGEANQMITFYSQEFGKINVLARGVRKIKSKLRSGVRIFSLAEIEFIKGKFYNTLTDAVKIDNFSDIKKNFRKLRIAFQCATDLDDLIGWEEKDEKVWELLTDFFENLNHFSFSKEIYYSLFYYAFLLNLLEVAGYGFDFYNCSFCQKKLSSENNFFSFEKGLVCQKCSSLLLGSQRKRKILAKEIKIFRLFQNKDWKIVFKLKPDEDFKKTFLFLEEYKKYVLENIL